jgi:hypothetical protein
MKPSTSKINTKRHVGSQSGSIMTSGKALAEDLKFLMELEGWFEDEDEKRSNPDSIYDENGMATIYF